MLNDFDESFDRKRNHGCMSAAHICLQPGHPQADQAARLIQSRGGRPCLPVTDVLYEFPTALQRDQVLASTRSALGRTVATPFDGRMRIRNYQEPRFHD